MSDLTIPLTQRHAINENLGGPIVIKDNAPVVQQKDLKPGEILVKILYSGVCHTDLHITKNEWPGGKQACVGGHEGTGYVVAIADHTETGLKIGDRVGIKYLADACLACEQCNRGSESTCATHKASGYHVDGTFGQFVVSYAKYVTPIPENLDLAMAAPILCAGITIWKAIKTAGLIPGQFIVIVGAGGGLGHLGVQYATAIGLRVVGIDGGADKRELAMKLGAETFIDFKETPDLIAEVKKATGGEGAHAAVVSAPAAAAYEQALMYLRPSGTLVVVGLPDTTIKASILLMVGRSLRIVASSVGNREDAKQALDFVARGKVQTSFTLRPLSALPSVFEDMEENKVTGRIVLDLWA